MERRSVLSSLIITALGAALCVLTIGALSQSYAEGSPSTTKSQEALSEEGLASFYTTVECRTKRNPRALTASGEPLDDSALTCAHRSAPFGSIWEVTTGKKTIQVRCNDRGPNKKYKERVIDLTRRGFSELAPLDKGLVRVTIRRIK